MYILKRLFALLLVLVFLSTTFISAMAVDYDAETSEEVSNAFNDSSEDSHVNINVKSDINMGGSTVTAKEGKTYNVNTQNNSSLSNVSVGGSGTVNINTDVKGTGGNNALTTVDSVTVNVKGNISSEENGVEAKNNSKVTVNGDIQADGDGVKTEGNSKVTVNGNIIADEDGVYASDNSDVKVTGNIVAEGDGVDANGKSNVTVNGDIDADCDGVDTSGSSTVSVTGKVTAGDNGVEANNENGENRSKVTINGDIYARNNGVEASGSSTVTVEGDVSGRDGDSDVDFDIPWDGSDGGDGIEAEDAAKVTVTGNVKGGNGYGTWGYGGDAVNADDTSTVIIGGNAVGGSVIADPSTKAAEDDGYVYRSVAGTGVSMDSTANVKVGGNAIGGSTNGNQGKGGLGVYLNMRSDEAGSLTVGGQVKSGTGGEDGESFTDLYIDGYGYGDLPAITMGACGTVGGYNWDPYGELTQEQLEAILAQIKITGLNSGLSKPEGVIVQCDLFWTQVAKQIRAAEPGSELTVDVGGRTSIPVYILNAAAQREITLIIKWNGGPDIVVKNAVEVTGETILLSELAKLVK